MVTKGNIEQCILHSMPCRLLSVSRELPSKFFLINSVYIRSNLCLGARSWPLNLGLTCYSKKRESTVELPLISSEQVVGKMTYVNRYSKNAWFVIE